MLTKIKQIKEYPLFLIVCILLAGMLALYVCKRDTDFSDMENRYLARRPSLTASGLADGTFMNEFETYTDEQIPFRNFLIKLKACMESLTLKNENNGIVCGKDGYLFEKVMHTNKQLFQNEQLIEAFIAKVDRPVLVAIVPNACEILKEYVPTGMPVINQGEEINRFNQSLSNYSNCTIAEMEEALCADKTKQLYYRTDHHWTTMGAYDGYREICKVLGQVPVEISQLTMKSVPNFYGTLYAKYKGFGISPDEITYYDIPIQSLTGSFGVKDSLYDAEKTQVYDKYAMFLYGNDGLCEINSELAGNDRSLIVFKDSYANCLIPFLTYQYDTIKIVDLRYYNKSVQELLKENEMSDILLLYNFSHLNDDKHFYRLTT